MKITCNTKLLATAVINVCRAVSLRSTISALEGILLVAENEKVILSGYDLEIGIKTKIDATVKQPGSIILNAKLLSDIVRKMPKEEISITSDDNNMVIISSGISKFSISAQSGSEFPQMPEFNDDDNIIINAGKLKKMIEQTLFAIAVSDSKPIHTGSLMECKNKTLTLVSVDGVRLALKKTNISYEGEKSIVIPGKTLSEIPKLITDLDQDIKISISNKNVIFEIEECTVISRLLEGNFLDYKSSIPQDHLTQVIISPKDLIDSIERTSLVIFDKLKAPIKLTIEENLIKFNCQSPTGNAYDELVCKISGEQFEIGFNSKIMLDALKVIDDENVRLLFNGPLSPMKIMPLDGDEFIFLILPVRLKSEDKTEN